MVECASPSSLRSSPTHDSRCPGNHCHGHTPLWMRKRRTRRSRVSIVFSFRHRDSCWSRQAASIASNASPAARASGDSASASHSPRDRPMQAPSMPRRERGIQSSDAINPGDAHVKAPKRPSPVVRRWTTSSCTSAGRGLTGALENMHQMQYAAFVPERRGGGRVRHIRATPCLRSDWAPPLSGPTNAGISESSARIARECVPMTNEMTNTFVVECVCRRIAENQAPVGICQSTARHRVVVHGRSRRSVDRTLAVGRTDGPADPDTTLIHTLLSVPTPVREATARGVA